MEHRIERVAKLWVGLLQRGKNLVEKLSHGGRFLVDVVLVPAQLVIIHAVDVAIGVAEGDVLDILVVERMFAGREVILYLIHQQGVAPRDHVHQPALSAGIFPHDGYLLSVLEAEVDGMCHAAVGMPRDAVCYLYYLLHSLNKSLSNKLIINYQLYFPLFACQVLPCLVGALALWTSQLMVVAVGDCQCVGGVHLHAHLALREVENALQHVCHLLLRG